MKLYKALGHLKMGKNFLLRQIKNIGNI